MPVSDDRLGENAGFRPRKLVGVFALLAGLPIYAGLAVWLALTALPDHGLIEIAYYLAAGIAWIFPVMPLIRWMNRDHAPSRNR
ncbi:MAG: hypothetical protein Tsb0010_09070 [Parvularculaceae bacterium]